MGNQTTNCDSNQKWKVKLSGSHKEYKEVYFCKRHDSPKYTAIELDLSKFIYYCEKNSYIKMAPLVEEWDNQRFEGVRRFLAPEDSMHKYYPEMPIAHFNIEKTIEYKRYYLFFKKKIIRENIYVSFTNGRHRTRYLQFSGATKIWIMCPNSDVDYFNTYCNN